jgi:Fur family transcriptional regulator, peroxide stress response regulator
MAHLHDPTRRCKPLAEDELRLALERGGWRFTRQRAAVYAYLCSVASHPTAEHVFAAVRRAIPNISLATVYKALEALVAVRVAARITDDAGVARYDGRAEAHYHLRCEATGEILDLPLAYDPKLVDKIDPRLADMLRRQGFEITGHRLELVGYFQPK